MKIGDYVFIYPIQVQGRIVAIIKCEYGTKYEVRYFWEGHPVQEWFFIDEIGEVKTRKIGDINVVDYEKLDKVMGIKK